MLYCSMDSTQVNSYRFNNRISLLLGFTRLVRLVLRAWRTLVRARVFFILCAWAKSGAALQSLTRGTVRFARGPVSQRQLRLTLPLLALRFHTMRCSVMNSWALTVIRSRKSEAAIHPHIA